MGSRAGAVPSGITPRWEWRLIQSQLPIGAEELAALVTRPPRDSTETYLLSSAAPHNVKLRGGKLEIKALEAVHPSGLERWCPVLSATFPVSRQAVALLNEALGLGAFALPGPILDAGSLLRQLPPRVVVVPLCKRRHALTLDGCPGEWVLLEVGGRQLQSLSLEHPDPARILDVLHARQLHPEHNTSYPTALLRLMAGVSPMSHTGA
jgi:hypothetical protein